MRQLKLIAAVSLLVFGLLSTADARYLLDEYFGVNLSVNAATGRFNMPWTPTRGSMIHEDWRTDGDSQAPDPGPRYYLSEVFDLEALYLDINKRTNEIVYSIVTSMPPTGFNQVPWYPGYVFRAGDIRFNIGSNMYVVGTFGATFGNLYYNPTMIYTDGHRGFGSRGNPILAPGSTAMAAPEMTFSYEEYLREDGSHLLENGYYTYIMEGRISLSTLGGDVNAAGMTLGMSCNNDLATVTTTAIPEPGTLTLIGFGLAGLYGATRKRKKN